MAEVKWIKIVTDVFDDEKILLIETLPDADALIVIWFKLLCLAGKQNNSGVFLMNNKIPYTEEMLAAILRRPVNTVKLALQTFENFGMVEIVDGVITIPNWDKHQRLDQLEMAKEQTRQRVAKHRAKQKEMLLGMGVTEEICVYCGEKGTTIDHVIPKAKGGLDIKENVVPCCIHCNKQKNDYDLEKFLNDRLIMGEKVDIERVTKNDILKEYVEFDYLSNRFVTLRNVTEVLPVTQCNANRIDKIRLDKDKNRIDKKYKYGEYNRVELTQNEYEKLCSDFGKDFIDNQITLLDEYVESNNNKNKYKNFNLVLRKSIRENWFIKQSFTTTKENKKNNNSISTDDLYALLDE